MIKYYNLQRMADFLKSGKVNQEMFNMDNFRAGDKKTPECNSIACVIGWCTELDMGNIKFNFLDDYGSIDFIEWSEYFTGITSYGDVWRFLFGHIWSEVDNTLEGAIKRLEYVIKNGEAPEDWDFNKGTVKLYNA